MPPRRRDSASSQSDIERPHPWLSMSLYWLFCTAVALRTGYSSIILNKEGLSLSSSSSSSSSLPSTKLLFLSLLATLAPQPFYSRAVSERAAAARPGRRDWKAIVCFTVVNSLLETAVFKATVDLGAAAAATKFSFFSPTPSSSSLLSSPSSSSSSSLASFLLLSAYCGIIHALFWDKCAFPPHRPTFLVAAKEAAAKASERRTRAAAAEEEERAAAKIRQQRSAMNTALLLFFPMTAAWHRLLLLAVKGDSESTSAALAAVVALHAVADFSASFSLRLRGPAWARAR